MFRLVGYLIQRVENKGVTMPCDPQVKKSVFADGNIFCCPNFFYVSWNLDNFIKGAQEPRILALPIAGQ